MRDLCAQEGCSERAEPNLRYCRGHEGGFTYPFKGRTAEEEYGYAPDLEPAMASEHDRENCSGCQAIRQTAEKTGHAELCECCACMPELCMAPGAIALRADLAAAEAARDLALSQGNAMRKKLEADLAVAQERVLALEAVLQDISITNTLGGCVLLVLGPAGVEQVPLPDRWEDVFRHWAKRRRELFPETWTVLDGGGRG